ncbi:lipid droplet-regulating VLDL assembly factor AUP1-like [Panonychus citri]|uniref:lipid droplet-regulating VLDL assembly factor AUP1-like n=1 Tax=Panonychus citri TaxID=50023 RepID=UPI002306DDB1|nr:lipid droplet-regulating VLDL assembly factor AUP1-like [Panonychus citri]
MNSSNDIEIDQMAVRVKEILPHVPLKTIQTDLRVTTDIDETIARLLDGVLSFQPEAVDLTKLTQAAASKTSSSFSSSINNGRQGDDEIITSNGVPASFNTAAKVFGKSPNERMLSFKDRKKNLIEAARQRYIKKHGLKLS